MAKKAVKRKKKKQSSAPVFIAILAVVIVLAIVYFVLNGLGPGKREADQNSLFNIQSTDSAAIIINGRQMEEYGKVVDDRLYISYDFVWNSINSGFYLEQDTLYMTLPEGTYTWSLTDDSGVLYRDGSEITYILTDCIAEYSDLKVETFTDPYRIVVTDYSKGIEESTVTAEGMLRVRADEKSDIAAEASEGEKVILLEAGEKWSMVALQDGHTGYIKSECISEGEPVSYVADERFIFPSVEYPDTIKMVWHYIDRVENNQYLDGMLADTKGINIICPTWFGFSDPLGNIYSYADSEYITKAKDIYGLSVWAMIGDYTGKDGSTGDILADASGRKNCISSLMEQALTYGIDGINIDFETITIQQAPAYLQFLRELTLAAHEHGLVVSVDNYVPTYTKQYKRSEQNKIVDYVVIMGYDEHTGGSNEIGSVASIGFVEDGIIQTLNEVAPRKTVLGVPFYTRGWTETFGSEGFGYENLDMTEQTDFILEHGIELYWNENAGQNMGSAEKDNVRYSIWVEDAQSMEKKLEMVKKYGLAGASAWRLGTETADIWDVWTAQLN